MLFISLLGKASKYLMNKNKFQSDKDKYRWLGTLLETYDISDELIVEHLKTINHVACKNGCSNCCKNPTVPFTEPELMGISWFASEKLEGSTRERVKLRLYNHESTVECPFLLDNSCSIYEVRPLVCRQFYVQNEACGEEEDILSSRPDDIISPTRAIAKASSMKLLEHWNYKSKIEKERAFESGVMFQKARNMHEYDWTQIAKTMEIFEKNA